MGKSNRRKQSRNRSSNKNARKRGARAPTLLGGVDLPHINQKPIQTRCMRYQSDGMTPNTVYVFSVNDMRALLLATTTGSSTAIPLIDSFKVRRVGYSAVLSGATGSAAVTFAWEGPNVPDISDTSYVGVGVPTTRSYYPPEITSTGWWYDNGAPSVELFSLTQTGLNAGVASIYLDLDFEYILQNGQVTTVNLATASGLTGIQYPGLPLTTLAFVPTNLSVVETA